MRYLVLTSVIALLLIGLTQPVVADTFVRTSGQYELPLGQTIGGNFLGVGNPVSVAGRVEADATVVGNRVSVSGQVGQDLLAFGIIAWLDGEIGEDVRIVSGNTTVSGTINGDVLVLSGSTEVLSDAVIEGDLLLYGGSASVSGTVSGDVVGSLQQLTINGPVGGGVDVAVQQLSLGTMASITESVRYASSNLLTQGVNTVVGGTILRNDPVLSSGSLTLQSVVWPFLIFIFSTLTWMFLSRKTLTLVVTNTVRHLPRSAMTGVISIIILPLIAFVLFISMLGGFVAVVVLVGYALLLLLAATALPAIIGHVCMKIGKMQGSTVSIMSILIGSVVCGVFLLLPNIGLFTLLFLGVIAFGGLMDSLIRSSR